MAELSPVSSLLPLGTEWRPWEVWHPPATVVQVTHLSFYPEEVCVTIDPSEFEMFDSLPASYRRDLYWRLTGIGKQQIEGLDR